jgi:hypothetical protein
VPGAERFAITLAASKKPLVRNLRNLIGSKSLSERAATVVPTRIAALAATRVNRGQWDPPLHPGIWSWHDWQVTASAWSNKKRGHTNSMIEAIEVIRLEEVMQTLKNWANPLPMGTGESLPKLT